MLAPTSRWGIELVAFTPVGFPAAVLGLAGALVLLRRWRLLGRAVLAVAVGLAALHGWWIAPQLVGAVPQADPAGPGLVVMTQNLEEGDGEEVVALVQRHDVDVLVLTDTPQDQIQSVVDARISDLLPFTTLGNASGTVVWSRHPISSDALLSDGGDSRVVALDVPGPAEVTLVAVHPTPPYQADGTLWRRDWDQVLARIRNAYGDTVDGQVLVVGDFNATTDHGPVRSLLGMGLRDVSEQLNSGPSATWPANGKQDRFGITIPPLLALDHVLTSPGLVPTALVLVEDAGSDHLGVIATLTRATG